MLTPAHVSAVASSYRDTGGEALKSRELILSLLERSPEPFSRSQLTPGQISCTGLVIDRERLLIVHHRRLDRWLLPGRPRGAGRRVGLGLGPARSPRRDQRRTQPDTGPPARQRGRPRHPLQRPRALPTCTTISSSPSAPRMIEFSAHTSPARSPGALQPNSTATRSPAILAAPIAAPGPLVIA